MLNKPCQETALHILSSIVGADEAPLQYSGRTGFKFLYYIQTHIHGSTSYASPEKAKWLPFAAS